MLDKCLCVFQARHCNVWFLPLDCHISITGNLGNWNLVHGLGQLMEKSSSPWLLAKSARVIIMHLDLLVCLFVYLSAHVTHKLLLLSTWFFYKRSITPVARSSSEMNRIWTQSCTKASQLRDRTKYAIKATTSNVCYDENMRRKIVTRLT